MKKILLALALPLLACGAPAHAIVTLDANVFYFSDAFVTGSTDTYNRLMWDGALSLSLTKKGGVMLGWAYSGSSFTDNVNSVENTLSITGMGPKITFYLDRDNAWSAGFTYYIVLNATQSGAQQFTYTGTGMKGEFGYLPAITENFFMGVKLNYYKATLAQKITNQTSLQQVSYGRTAIYPSLSLTLRFE